MSGQEQVYLNGILLVRSLDYTATNGTSITGLTALAADDFVQINCYNNFSVASVPAASITGEVTNSQITSLATSKLTGTITNAQLAGSIANDKLTNSSITINGSAVALGGSVSLAGDIESVTAGTGISGGGSSGAVTITNSMATAIDAKGDLIVGTGSATFDNLTVGANGTVLTADSSVSPTGLKWATPAGGGKVLQVVSATTNTFTQVASTSFTDSGLSVSITPSSASSKVLVLVSQSCQVTAYANSNAGSAVGYIALLRTSTQIAGAIMQVAAAMPADSETQLFSNQAFSVLDSPATTSAVTYKTQGKVNSTANSRAIGFQRFNTGDTSSSIVLLEIGA
jgi:hypothetical protein